MNEKKSKTSKLQHKESLKAKRIKRLEDRMKSNIKKRKKTNNNNG
tara:strand:+ start:240 stop:374 length:135 start_codon:yes stop_codon:yes gene_type:complete